MGEEPRHLEAKKLAIVVGSKKAIAPSSEPRMISRGTRGCGRGCCSQLGERSLISFRVRLGIKEIHCDAVSP
ncbi:hypothetical protein [Anabaena azotica]|uniref:Uncharacterized protein n=1 Tax=Anabaena azotica FACHB-119 TaxID=947527 RepID=A0ABR8DGF5_9NOST|nr:hypothetical protein [Anabaena azotica]MBD2505490.1 hypothetical protein [Anabaena azotica FACHB-119]